VRILVGLPVIALALVTCTAQAASTSWNCGEGLWNETQRWKPSRPDRKTICQVRGKSRVSLLQGEAFAGSLDVGLSRDDDSRLIIDGGELTVLLGLRMGEYTGSTGLLELKSGVIHAANVYVGSANYYDAGANRSTGTFRISGGSLDCRLICLGMGQGSQATLEIVGSRASRIDVLDFVSLGTAALDDGLVVHFGFTWCYAHRHPPRRGWPATLRQRPGQPAGFAHPPAGRAAPRRHSAGQYPPDNPRHLHWPAGGNTDPCGVRRKNLPMDALVSRRTGRA